MRESWADPVLPKLLETTIEWATEKRLRGQPGTKLCFSKASTQCSEKLCCDCHTINILSLCGLYSLLHKSSNVFQDAYRSVHGCTVMASRENQSSAKFGHWAAQSFLGILRYQESRDVNAKDASLLGTLVCVGKSTEKLCLKELSVCSSVALTVPREVENNVIHPKYGTTSRPKYFPLKASMGHH